MSKKTDRSKMQAKNYDSFARRHIGNSEETSLKMLNDLGFNSMDNFIQSIVPESIYSNKDLKIDGGLSEEAALRHIKKISKKNHLFKSYIGQGFYNSITPSPIQKNVFENPGWYTSYTPYQPEIAQGRLEALINYQTMVADLTGMEIANASLLDEPTAAAEAMTLTKRLSKSKSDVFLVDENCFSQTQHIIKTRAKPLGIEIKVLAAKNMLDQECFGAFLQYPDTNGVINNYSHLVEGLHKKKGFSYFCNRFTCFDFIKASR